MTIQMNAGQSDDPNFIELLNALLQNLLADSASERVWIIEIDNWFDHKWLGFSGHGLVKSGIPVDIFDTAIAAFYRGKMTFPPFNPNRVSSQWSYVRTETGYEESALPMLPHRSERRRISGNLQRRIHDFDTSACLIWYSSNTRSNDRASVMVYTSSADGCDSWFASFRRRNRWALDATKGVKSSDVEQLLKSG